MGGAFSHFCCIDLCQGLMKRLRSPQYSERLDYEGDEAEAPSRYSERLDYEGDEAEASSPPSSPPPSMREKGFEYDVFLSFRGPDTRNGFTSHLHAALEVKGILAFIDSQNLEKGQKVEELFECIQKSKVFVPIFSKGYADSKWCLKEITKIVECKRLIIPVFFDVEPKDVRHQTGPFADAFRSHLENVDIDMEEVCKWSAALTEAGKVSGYDLASTCGNQSMLVEDIVRKIVREVNKTPLPVAEHPVGLNSRIADLMKMMEIEAHTEAKMVGIHGLGGVGKTTVAKDIYNQISSHFDACCFLFNVRSEAKNQSDRLISLQKQLLRKVFKDENTDISSIDEGISIIKQRIRSKKVLLVLDDVDHESQLEALAGGVDWFCSGSRIIITTRDKRMLRAAGVHKYNMYKLKGLDSSQSLQLFSWHAFRKEEPDLKFAKLSKEVASVAAGLPLALKIFGSLFRYLETVELWVSKLEELKKSQDNGLHEMLKISYDALDENAQKVFLDIACFFIGQGREKATYMWEGCGFFPDLKINVLICMCLVSVNDDTGEFEMHDHIRDMGRKIVQDESNDLEERSRLREDDEALDVLQKRRGTKNIEAIHVSGEKKFSDRATFCSEEWTESALHVGSFAAMSQLRMLRLQRVMLEGNYEHIPQTLRWLEWHPHDLDSLPNSLPLENIVVLDLSYSSITQVWNQQGSRIKVFDKLKVLNLSDCCKLSMCPDFTSMPHLEKLDFSGCKKIRELHPSIGHLERLTYLSLRSCVSLQELPRSIRCLKNLIYLSLRGCKLKKLPKSVGHLKNLTYLSLSCSSSLKKLPEEVCQLTSLEKLNLNYCTKISNFPLQLRDSTSLTQHFFDKLKVLNLSRCTNLTNCPDFTCMPHLEKLKFNGCKKMSELHPSIGHLKSLSRLSLGWCESLMELPDEVCQLASLENLYLNCCKQIAILPSHLGDLKSLVELFLDSTSITTLPESVGHLKQLKYLSLNECSSLKEIPECICVLLNLEEIDAKKCESLASLPNSLGNLRSLRKLDLSETAIEELPDSFVSLEKLDVLAVAKCTQLKFIPASASTSIVSSDRQHYSLPQFPPFLTKLNASNCPELEMIADVSNAKGLKKLNLNGCQKLVDVPGVEQLKRLVTLKLGGCRSLCNSLKGRLQEANFQHLHKFNIRGNPSDGEPSCPQSLSFVLPRQFNIGFLYLYVEESCLGNIGSEHWAHKLIANLHSNGNKSTENEEDHNHSIGSIANRSIESRDEGDNLDKSIASGEGRSLDGTSSEQDENNESDEDSSMDSFEEEEDKCVESDEDTLSVDSLGKVVRIDITTDAAQFVFKTSIEKGLYGRSPNAMFGWKSKLMRIAREGKFMGADDAPRRTTMVMHVSVNGCALLGGDLQTVSGEAIDGPSSLDVFFQSVSLNM